MFYFTHFKGKCLNIGLMDVNEPFSMTKTKNKVFQYHHIKLLGFVHAIIGCSVTKQPSQRTIMKSTKKKCFKKD